MYADSSPRLQRVLAAGLSVGIAALLCLGSLAVGEVAGGAASQPASASSFGGLSLKGSSATVPRATSHGPQGPHPGTLEIWEATGGGPSEADPSVCYYTVCDEPIANVYETLVAYNGTQDGPAPASYVPQIATCVPGSAECSAQFGGNDLVWLNNTTGAPQYYTFEIDSGARFYDPATGVGWPVYPSDVVFTFARTMGFADLPYEEATPGWINTQDLVGPGNEKWDSGIHAPLNNTPQSILRAFLVNDSAYCPGSTLTLSTNGCVTFDVGASGVAWPFFLNLVADNLGASIEPCGWYTANGGGVPGFLGTNASNGDGPCLLPGNSVNTQQAGYKNYVSSTPATGWDTFEMLANNIPAIQPGVQWNEVGSGPYYVENPIAPTVGYTLHTNPDYNAPVGCAGQPGCMPLKGSYQGTVDVIWEASGDTQGLNAMADGQADSAGFFTPETGTVLGLGNYTLLPGIPGLTTFFDLVNLNFSEVGYADLGAPPTNIPATFFQNIALRNFLVSAYPYTSVDQTYNCVDGICFGEDYGGAIPHGMGDYYPSNITWPGGNPVSSPSTPGNVAWWWAQANNVSSQWYDSQLASCTTGSPCTWDDMTTLGNTETIGEFELWNAEIFNLSGGALEPGYFELSTQDICSLGCPPGQNPLPIYPYGWVADYPDPSDFMAPMYYPDNSYTAPDAVSEVLQASPNNATSCPHDYSAWSNLTYYANIGLLPTACQGAGYDTMTAWENAAAHESNINLRMLEYNLIEHIANELALYIYNPQVVVAIDFGDWIEGSTTNTNPAIGGAGIQLWYDWGYAANYFDVTFRESGLPAGADWGVTLAGETLGSNSTSNVTSAPLTNGTYPYNVGSLSGYLAMPSNGTVVINGSNVFLSVVFSCLGCGEVFAVAFQEGGLSAGTPWGVVVTGLGGTVSLNGTATTLSANLPEGSYNYTPESVPGYYPPVPGQVNVTGNTTVNLTYSGSVSISYYAVSFIETGLPSGATWSILINGTTITRINSTLSTTLVNGSYAWGIVSLPSGYAAIPSEGDVVISGAPVTVHVTITTPTILPRSSGGFSTPDWLIIGSVVLVALGVGLLVWRVKVQRGRPPDPKTNPALGPPLP